LDWIHDKKGKKDLTQYIIFCSSTLANSTSKDYFKFSIEIEKGKKDRFANNKWWELIVKQVYRLSFLGYRLIQACNYLFCFNEMIYSF
jgi:hypothetical protein